MCTFWISFLFFLSNISFLTNIRYYQLSSTHRWGSFYEGTASLISIPWVLICYVLNFTHCDISIVDFSYLV
ncbi:hypothetical protein BD408DRAFT_427003 [Parasitella parasitica]|nr:hypothetical protein BD408DRAFT_427003 [Parasitella parasitica]